MSLSPCKYCLTNMEVDLIRNVIYCPECTYTRRRSVDEIIAVSRKKEM